MKAFLYFTRGERRGVLLLSFLLLFLWGGYSLWKQTGSGRTLSADEVARLKQEREEYYQFVRSLRVAERFRTGTMADGVWQREAASRLSAGERWAALLTPFPFDPNMADSQTFCRLGLPGWMAGNILRYRRRGGRFRQAEDFRKIYGLTAEQFEVLHPYITIDEAAFRQNTFHGQALEGADRRESLSPDDGIYLRHDTLAGRRFPEKYPAGTVLALNQADTIQLMRIPGIGSGIARMITGYRQRLGGFCRIEQLGEINLDYKQLEGWFSVDPQQIKRINLNRAGVEQLRRHPYINYYQAKAIVEYRKKRGNLKNLKPFLLLEEFTEADLERIAPYVSFE